MCVSVLPVTFFAIVLLLSPETLMTETHDTPCAEACAAMVSENLLTLLLKGFLWFFNRYCQLFCQDFY